MPNNGSILVKCEPPSDEEDATSQFSHAFLHDQNTSDLGELPPLEPLGPAATPVCVKQEPGSCPIPTTLETLEPAPANNAGSTYLERHMTMHNTDIVDSSDFMPLLVKDEPTSEGEGHASGDDTRDSCSPLCDSSTRSGLKSWTVQDMENALDALRKQNMSLTKASARFGIPSTTLWQRAHRLGIDTPKKDAAAKSWSEADLRGALQALRAGAISANKASKAYGIPSSTLYKIARREGIRLAAPFNAAPTAWRRDDLRRALAAIRNGASSVQRAAALFGIPTGTLYGRCKREGIELSRSNPTPWSEDAMGEALEAVRVGQMSINQAAIHYNLPYSSLYGRFKRCKYQMPVHPTQHGPDVQNLDTEAVNHQEELYYPHMHAEHGQSYAQHYTHNEFHDTSTQNSSGLEPHYTAQAMYYAQNCNIVS